MEKRTRREVYASGVRQSEEGRVLGIHNVLIVAPIANAQFSEKHWLDARVEAEAFDLNPKGSRASVCSLVAI
eukprot:3864646-Pleurochrysis_carterae.AAC.1